MERWSQFEETKHMLYYISTLGKAKSIRKNNGVENVLTPEILLNGYRRIRFAKNVSHKGKRYSVHRLVAIAFIPNPHNLPEVNHIIPVSRGGSDEFTNLEWCTGEDNRLHAQELGLGHKSVTVLNYDGHVMSEHSSIVSAIAHYDIYLPSKNTVVRNGKEYTYNYVYNEHVKQYKKGKMIFIHKEYYEQLSQSELNDILKWFQQ